MPPPIDWGDGVTPEREFDNLYVPESDVTVFKSTTHFNLQRKSKGSKKKQQRLLTN
jgi:hypothetical protein